MKQLLTVAKLTFQLPFRTKGGWFIYFLVSAVALFMFSVSRSDGVLINELQLRIRFSLVLASAVLSLVLLWYACVSMRGDIDAKRTHLLTSYPIHRALIYLGKWLGLLAFAFFGFLLVCAVVATSSLVMVWHTCDADQVTQVKKDYWRLARVLHPHIPDAAAIAEERYDELRKSGKLPEEWRQVSRDKAVKLLREDTVRRQQLVKKNGRRSWPFQVGRLPDDVDTIVLEYRFYSHDRQPVKGTWGVYDENLQRLYQQDVYVRPFQTHQLLVPTTAIPQSGEMFVQFNGRNNPPLIFYNKTGLRLLYREGTLLSNLPRYLLIMFGHFGLVIAVGLTIASAFTLSVASFVSMVLYLVAFSSSFFVRAVERYRFDEDAGVLVKVGGVMTRLGLFLIAGMEAPQATEPLSGAVHITADNIGMQVSQSVGNIVLLPVSVFSNSAYTALCDAGVGMMLGFVLYFAIVMGGGIWLFKRKELDRIH